MANIIIYDIAANSGGALTILKQFLEEAEYYGENKYYVFGSAKIQKSYKNIDYIYIEKPKNLVYRIIWDMYKLKRYLKNKKIKPDLIISMQNIALIGFKGIPQIIYLHQAIPFSNIKVNPMKKEERRIYFYKYIYKIIIFATIILVHGKVYVQTEWMEKEVKKFFFNTIKIKKIRPKIEIQKRLDRINKENKNILIYPTSDVKYKNINTIINAIKYLKEINNNIFAKTELNLTINKNYKYSNAPKNIKFIGYKSKEEIISLYENASAMLFPSYLESFGLPLIEAASFGLPIIVSDLPYSRELLGNYDGVKFIKNYMDKIEWANAIVEVYKEQKDRHKPLKWSNEDWSILFKDINNILNKR